MGRRKTLERLILNREQYLVLGELPKIEGYVPGQWISGWLALLSSDTGEKIRHFNGVIIAKDTLTARKNIGYLKSKATVLSNRVAKLLEGVKKNGASRYV